MERYREALKQALSRLVQSGEVKDLASWCRRAGFGSSTVHEFLAGRTRSITLEKLDALASVAGVPVATLIGEAPAVLTSDDVRLVTALRKMDQKQKQELLDWLGGTEKEAGAAPQQ